MMRLGKGGDGGGGGGSVVVYPNVLLYMCMFKYEKK